MSMIAIGVTNGTPNVSGQVPVTSSDAAAQITQASTDLTTLAGAISTAASDTSTVATNTSTVYTDTSTVVTDLATAITDFNLAFGTGTDGLTTLLGASISYNATTMQFSGTMDTSATITAAQGIALYTLINTATTALLLAQTDAGTAKTDADTAKTNASTANTAVGNLSTTTVASDLTNAQDIISGANVYIQSDTSVVGTSAGMNGALLSALQYMRAQGILST